MAPKRRIFLSAVSGEFQTDRQNLATTLRGAGFEVEEQETLVQRGGAPTLLGMLDRYIAECDGAVFLIGDRTGSYPKDDEAAAFADKRRLSIPPASYTQWEFHLTRHYGRHLYCYRALPAFKRFTDAPNDPAQAAYVAAIRSAGIQLTNVSDAGQWERTVLQAFLKDGLLPPSPADRPIVLPYPPLGHLFKGRDAFLTRLRESLLHDSDGTAAIVSNAIHGAGGIGKTRAAVEYAWAYRDTYTALLFVQADSPENLDTNLAAQSGPLRLPEATAPDQTVQLNATKAWLRTNPGWLLILDNVDTEPARDAALSLLGQLQGGHVVLTSRLDGGVWDGVQPLDLDLLDLPAAAAYLMDATAATRLQRPDDQAQAEALADALGQLALALALAAGTIKERQCSFADYRILWDQAREKVRGWNQPKVTFYHSAVAQTWQTSVTQVSNGARVLLERLAFLAPAPIPGSLLDVPVPDTERLDARELLLELARYSLVTRQSKTDQFTIHRLVQDATRRGLTQAMARTRLTEALGWVDAEFIGNAQDVRIWPLLDPLAPHAEEVVTRADAADIIEPTTAMMGRLAILFHTKSAYRRAEPFHCRALAIAEANFPENDPRIATCLNNLALLLQATNRIGEAEPLMRRALAIDEASFGSNHPKVAIRLNSIALLLQVTNRQGEAVPLLRRALATFKASYGPDHPDVATNLNNLALLLKAINRFDEAEPLIRRALAIDETSYGKDHPSVATNLNNLAQLLKDTNRLSEAEPLLRRALAIDEASYGPDHPNVAIHLINLALLLQDTNRLDEAEPLMHRALAIDEASYGKDHPEVATDLHNLASLLQATNRLGEAEPLMRRALAIHEASYGKDHPSVARDLNNLAVLLQATNRLDEAEPLMRRALSIHEASYGKDHPDVAIDLNNLAQLLKATNRLGKAEPLMRRALAIDEASYGKDHPDVAIHLNNLAGLLQATNRLEEAEPLMRRMVIIFLLFQRNTGHAHPHRDAAIGNYANLLAEMGHDKAAIRAAIESAVQEAGLD